MKAKKNEPLSNIGARTMQVMNKGASVTPTTPATSGTETTTTASLATSIEEIIPLWNKRQRIGDNLKYKANSRSFSVWDDVGVTLARAQETFITEEMKVFSSMSPNKVMGCHLHTLVQVMYLCKFIFSFPFLSFFFFFFFCIVLRSGSFFQVLGESLHITSKYLTQETKVPSAVSRVEALEAENSKLKKDLIAAMDEANTIKGKIKVMGDDLRVER